MPCEDASREGARRKTSTWNCEEAGLNPRCRVVGCSVPLRSCDDGGCESLESIVMTACECLMLMSLNSKSGKITARRTNSTICT